MVEYICPVCGVSLIAERSKIHDHMTSELSEKFQREGYKIIQEGKMPIQGWCEPDLFILQNSNLDHAVYDAAD